MAANSLRTIDKYIVLEDLGKGAKSRIWKVQDPDSGDIYALKHVQRDSETDSRFFEQVDIEYEVSSEFEHPFLRKSLELKRIRKWLKTQEVLLLMEYVEGINLKEAKLTDIEKIIDVFIMVCEGIGSMHNLGYVHADIKPKNILLVPDDGIKIIDFGQSCPIGHRKERVQGTPDYMAPEQARRNYLDQRTDVFSLGATLYDILTGTKYPTVMRTNQDGCTELTSAPNLRDIRRPDELNSDCPVSLSKLVMDCCNYEVQNRPENMREVLSRLEVARHLYLKNRGPRPEQSVAEPIAEKRVKPTSNYDTVVDDDSGEFEKFIESIL